MVNNVPSTTILIQAITISFLEENCNDLLKEHYEEVALNKSVMKLSPDWTKYYALEQSNMLLCLGAFMGDECVGYSINFLLKHLHYKNLFYMQNDLLFVAKEHRKSKVGLLLIQETEIQAKENGAEMMLWHAKEHTKLNYIMQRMKYSVQDIIYSKVL